MTIFVNIFVRTLKCIELSPRSRPLPDDSGIDSSSPQSSNFSSVDPLELRRGSDMQPHSETVRMSNTLPRRTRRRAMRDNEGTTDTKRLRIAD